MNWTQLNLWASDRLTGGDSSKLYGELELSSPADKRATVMKNRLEASNSKTMLGVAQSYQPNQAAITKDESLGYQIALTAVTQVTGLVMITKVIPSFLQPNEFIDVSQLDGMAALAPYLWVGLLIQLVVAVFAVRFIKVKDPRQSDSSYFIKALDKLIATANIPEPAAKALLSAADQQDVSSYIVKRTHATRLLTVATVIMVAWLTITLYSLIFAIGTGI